MITKDVLFLLLTIALVISCKDKKDEEKIDPFVGEVSGVWTLIWAYGHCDDSNWEDDSFDEQLNCSTTDCTKLEFTTDGKVKAHGIDMGVPYNDGEIGTYEILPDNRLKWCEGSVCEEWNYVFAGKMTDLYKGSHSKSLLLNYMRQHHGIPGKGDCWEQSIILVK